MYEKLRKIREARAEADRGFTLIELLVVVVIIGILIAIAIPLYLNYQKGAHDKSAQSDIRGAVSAMQQCFTDNGNNYPTAVTTTNNVATPADAACSSDVVNLSSGTTLVYKAVPANCDNTATPCTGFTLAASNSGGHHNASAAQLAAATGASHANAYWYDSAVGGQIN